MNESTFWVFHCKRLVHSACVGELEWRILLCGCNLLIVHSLVNGKVGFFSILLLKPSSSFKILLVP